MFFTRQDLIAQAIRLRDLGIGSIPLMYRGKNALVKWKVWAGRVPPRPLTERWIRSRWQCNLGVLLGVEREMGKLTVLDFDKAVEYVRWRRQYPETAQSYTVRTARGWHVYLWIEDAPLQTLAMPGGEIKATGYVVGEGSVHQSGTRYIGNNASILSVESLDCIGISVLDNPICTERPIEITPVSSDKEGGVVARIKDAISIVAYLSRWTDLRPKGDGTLIGICPFHQDTNPSLRVWPQEGRAYCYSPFCRGHRRCDVITCAEYALDVSTQDAIRLLAQELG